MRNIRAAVVAAAVVITVSACGGTQTTQRTLPPLRSIAEYPALPAVEGPDRTVEWTDYATDMQSTIEGLVAAGDCLGLQQQIAKAANDSALAMNRTGHTNAKLIGYIREQITTLGCASR
jgi:thioredoxin reductase